MSKKSKKKSERLPPDFEIDLKQFEPSLKVSAVKLLATLDNPELRDPANAGLVQAISATHLPGTVTIRNGWKYSNPTHWILAHGRRWQWAPLPNDVSRGPPKMCFYNSATLGTKREKLAYVEGYTVTGPLVLLHAWNVDHLGRVHDLTRTEDVASASQYFGVALRTEFVNQATARQKGISLVDNWTNGFPLLQNDDLLSAALHPQFHSLETKP